MRLGRPVHGPADRAPHGRQQRHDNTDNRVRPTSGNGLCRLPACHEPNEIDLDSHDMRGGVEVDFRCDNCQVDLKIYAEVYVAPRPAPTQADAAGRMIDDRQTGCVRATDLHGHPRSNRTRANTTAARGVVHDGHSSAPNGYCARMETTATSGETAIANATATTSRSTAHRCGAGTFFTLTTTRTNKRNIEGT